MQEKGIGGKAGNIDHYDRPVITWTDEEIEKQRKALESWKRSSTKFKNSFSYTIFNAQKELTDLQKIS